MQLITVYATWAGLALAAMSVGLAVFANVTSWAHRLMIAVASGVLILLAYLVSQQYSEEQIRKAAKSDVVAFLSAKGPMTFEDIYAKISPQRDFDTLSAAIHAAILERTIAAEPEQATLENNQIVGVRVYTATN